MTIAKRDTMDKGLIRLVKLAIDLLISFGRDKILNRVRVDIPASNGTTTYKTTDKIKVDQGTTTSVTPSKRATIGANANTIITSFIET